MHGSTNSLLKRLIDAHGATLKVFVWQLRSSKDDSNDDSDSDDGGDYENLPLADGLFEHIGTHCPALEEISVAVDWRQRYRVSARSSQRYSRREVH